MCMCAGFEVPNRYGVNWRIDVGEDERGKWLVWDQALPVAPAVELSQE